jgi:hypothetical protein
VEIAIEHLSNMQSYVNGCGWKAASARMALSASSELMMLGK